jgi:hypothetical protein
MEVVNHPGARAMNSKLVGEVVLANGAQVFVVSVTHVMDDQLSAAAERVRDARILDADGERIEGLSITSFGVENGVASFIDVTNTSR